MAFCNACGATLEAGAGFCNKCGTKVPAAVGPTTVATPPTTAQPPAKSGGALKVVLIIAAIVVGLGILGTVAATFAALHFAKRTRVNHRDGNVRVETPFGTVESSSDPSDLARDLGVDLYPGSTVRKGSSASMNIGGMHTSAAILESNDPAEKVFEFYKSKYPNANVVSSDDDGYSIVSGLTTIHIETEDGTTVVHISKVNKAAQAGM